jgi:hypothetical protein
VKTFIFHLAFQNAFEKLSFADQAFTYRLSNALAAVEPHLKVFDEGINRVFSLRLHRLWRILESRKFSDTCVADHPENLDAKTPLIIAGDFTVAASRSPERRR